MSIRRIATPDVERYVPSTTTTLSSGTPYAGIEEYDAQTEKWVPVVATDTTLTQSGSSSSMMLPLLGAGAVIVAMIMMKN